MNYVVSFSGGKDSTAMTIRLLEEGYPIDDIIFFDGGWEFPQMHEHIKKVQEYIGREITIIKPDKPFIYYMNEKPVKSREGPNKGQVHRIGNGWPSPLRRWCTRLKINALNKYCNQKHGKFYSQYVGFAADEIKRTGCGTACSGENTKGVERLYPLIFDWDMDEKECLQYCYDRGFDWGGLYKDFARVSCFCCPLSRLGELRTVRRKYPELWATMLKWDADMIKRGANKGFYNYSTVHDLDQRFSQEQRFYGYLEKEGIAV